jgi:glycosyltransferase involved in cell wall biosynthesis
VAGLSNARRRVVFLVWRDTRHPEGGGSEVYVEHMARHLARLGHDVTVCCAAHPGAPDDEVIDGVRFVRRGGRLSVYLHGLGYLLRAGRRADVVIDVQNGLPFFSPLVRRRRRTIVLVHHVHREQWQMVYPGWRGRLGWWLESRLAPRINRGRPYVTVSRASADELSALGVRATDITIVHNGVDLPRTDPTPRAPRPTVTVLARLVPHKQVEHALHAVAKLAVEVPELGLDVIGDGWWRDHLTTRCEELGIADRVTFHGHVSAEERDTLLDRSWVMLAPSVKEGWGLAVIEAAAHGVPTIAYGSAGGVRESVLDGVTGHLTGDLEELVGRTRELLLDDALRHQMSLSAREHALDFDWTTSAERFARHVLPPS